MAQRKGFTLIELMIVVVVIGILVTIAVPNFMRMRDNAKEAKVKRAGHTVQVVAEDYAAQHDGEYSDVAADLTPLFPGGGLLENAFTNAFSEPQFGGVAAAAGQVGIQAVAVMGSNIGYIVTCYGKSETILRLSNGS